MRQCCNWCEHYNILDESYDGCWNRIETSQGYCDGIYPNCIEMRMQCCKEFRIFNEWEHLYNDDIKEEK